MYRIKIITEKEFSRQHIPVQMVHTATYSKHVFVCIRT